MTGAGPPGDNERLVRGVRAVKAPGPRLVSGLPAQLLDTQEAVSGGLLPAGLVAGGGVTLLLFVLSGSVLIPIKALAMGVLSLGASFGAMVFVFQDGHLAWLAGQETVSGNLEICAPVLMFCTAFALSVDYEVFLISRVLEEHRLVSDPQQALVTGVAATSRVVTAAAALVAVALVPLATSSLALLKLLGCGLGLAVLVDATVVRAVLVPAIMQIAGPANWWAPPLLRRWHTRLFPSITSPTPASNKQAPEAATLPTARQPDVQSVPGRSD